MKRTTFHIHMPSLSHYYKEILKWKLWVITSQGILPSAHTLLEHFSLFSNFSKNRRAANDLSQPPSRKSRLGPLNRHLLPPSKSRAVRLSHPGRWLGTVQGTQSTVTSHSQPLFLHRSPAILAKRNKNARDRPERGVRAEAAADGVAAGRAAALSLTPPTPRRPSHRPLTLRPSPRRDHETQGSQAELAARANFRPGLGRAQGRARRPLRSGRRRRFPKTAETQTLSARWSGDPSSPPLVPAPGTRPEHPSLPTPLLT